MPYNEITDDQVDNVERLLLEIKVFVKKLNEEDQKIVDEKIEEIFDIIYHTQIKPW